MKIQLSVEDVEAALTNFVADTFSLYGEDDIKIARVIRKKGGGIEADVIVKAASLPLASEDKS